MNRPISLAFFGSSPNSTTVLKALTKAGFNIKLVVTAPPRPVGRKKQTSKTSVHEHALKENIPVATPDKLEKKFTAEFTSTPFEVAIVADYARLIPKDILNHPKHGFLNLHPSLLPKYRGSSPAEAAILYGDKATGLTIIKMDEKFDHGPIIAQFEEKISDEDTSETLYKKLFSAGARVLTTILPAWIEGQILPRKQNHKKATLAPRLTRDDGFIPWPLIQKAISGQSVQLRQLPHQLNQAAKQHHPKEKSLLPTSYFLFLIERSIRALHPWPGIWTLIEVRSFQKASPRGKQKSAVKKRMKILSAHHINGKLILHKVQMEGKNISSFNEIKNQIL